MQKAKLMAIVAALKEQHASQLDAMRSGKDKPFGLKPKQIEDMKCGFSDGLRSMWLALVAEKALVVEEG